MGTHTPGPWTIGRTAWDRADECQVHTIEATDEDGPIVLCRFSDRWGPIADADARLLASAPELLSALQLALPWLGKALADGAFDNCVGKRLAPDALASMQAAIAKATGESHA